MVEPKNSNGRTIELWILRVTIVGLLGWTVTLALDVAKINASRFTPDDWLLQSQRLEERMPPEWVRRDLADLKERVRRLELAE